MTIQTVNHPHSKQVCAGLFSFFVSALFLETLVCLPGFRPDEAARPGPEPPAGVTGSLVRSQGAVASNGGALHLVSRPQETGKQNLLLHAVLPTLNHLPWPNQVTPSSITSEQILQVWFGLSLTPTLGLRVDKLTQTYQNQNATFDF